LPQRPPFWRQAVVAIQTNLPVLSLTLTNANQGVGLVLSWNSNAATFTYQNTTLGTQTCLSGCDTWSYALFQRTPRISATNITFLPATNSTGQLTLSMCKLLDMSWKCSRTVLSQKINTESVQTAQIVFRNKQ